MGYYSAAVAFVLLGIIVSAGILSHAWGGRWAR